MSWRALTLDPNMVAGAGLPHVGRVPSPTRAARRADWAEFRRLARRNGCTKQQLAAWLVNQDVTWTNGIQFMRYVLGCARSEAETALWAVGVKL